MQYRGADIIVEMLARAGVRYMMGHPGHSVMELMDAAYTRQDRITPMLVRHEGVGSLPWTPFAGTRRPSTRVATS